MSRTLLSGLAAATITGSLLLTGCAESLIEEPSPEPVAVTEETATPEPEPVVLPECEQLVPSDRLGEAFSNDYELWHTDTSLELTRGLIGPSANKALEEAKQVMSCAWALPNSDVVTSGIAAELSDSTLQEFLASLRDSNYTEAPYEGAHTFRYAEQIGAYTVSSWYGLHGNVWVALVAKGSHDLESAGRILVDAVSVSQ